MIKGNVGFTSALLCVPILDENTNKVFIDE